ncbi:uncharacterized protein LOC143564561 [Bidens hawaiensis]|uniref:uncharacterized protein LOC143564561 n=1 Tax=Bidens hawaiensis TaxID=980011 RepID=UPI00404B2AC8
MLKTAEAGMGKKVSPVLMINKGGSRKRQHPEPKANVAKGKGHAKGKGKGEVVETPKFKPKKQAVASVDSCFECGKVGHWKQNCPTYLKQLKDKRETGQPSGVQEK